MIITLIGNKRIWSLRLPEKIDGKFFLRDSDVTLSRGRLLAVEAANDNECWVVPRQQDISLYDEEGNETDEIRLSDGTLFPIRHAVYGKCVLYVEEADSNNDIYEKYAVSVDSTIHIGKKPDNEIVIDNKYVSGHHAVLRYNANKWYISDRNSTNGTYISGYRIAADMELPEGTPVFIMGVKLVVGSGFFAINNPKGRVTINGFEKYQIRDFHEPEISDAHFGEREYYYRSPRFFKRIEPLEITVDAPTRSEDRDQPSILLAVGPALLMGTASFAVAILSVVNAVNEGRSIMTVIPSMVTALAMLAGMVAFPILMKRREARIRSEKEVIRREKYNKYISNLREEIEKQQVKQREVLLYNHPDIIALASGKDFFGRRLWEKAKEHDDFLTVRLGTGKRKMYATIRYPEERFSVDDDILRETLNSFCEEPKMLNNVPITVSLKSNRVFGIVGDTDGVFNILYSILLQIALLHSYDEVKVVAILDINDENRLPFMRYMKHIWNDEGKIRYLAVGEDGLDELILEMNGIVAKRRESQDCSPHYVIVSASKVLFNKCSFVQDILTDAALEGFTVLCAYEDVSELPKECKAYVAVNGGKTLLYDTQNADTPTDIAVDRVTQKEASELIYKMAGYEIDLAAGRYELPDSIGFMEMFEATRAEHLNIYERWQKNNPIKSLRAPVGKDTNGSLFYIDLHEKLHGPHGLIAGMTGSGKSEFIITYILSMAINYHPNEVAFVLIDYKGGGLVDAFDNEKYHLPHLAGTITNLDSGSIMRSILSIESELRRRQRAFRTARAIANEGTMDIYKYQRMYREGIVDEPIPHLFIVADEFAELKSQHAEFMDQLISTARIGRSLGVHLILATQKPAGVVNEQIWANSRFKVCLKVQDKADSNDMLKRPDAAELKETGRFYLQVGYNELFELGQSAYSGAAMPDESGDANDAENDIDIIDISGNVVSKLKTQRESADTNTQIVKIMEYLDRLSTEMDISERALWLPELEDRIELKDLMEKYMSQNQVNGHVEALVGEIDDPYEQRRLPLRLDFNEEGNILIYGATGSGKEMVIDAIVLSILSNYDSDKANIYIMDFDAETLGVYKEAPHVGGIVYDGEGEKVRSFFDMIKREMKRRKKVFSENAAAEGFADIIIIIHNYAHFYESYGQYEDSIISLTRESAKYGIFFVVTATSAGAIRYRLSQNFNQTIVLALNDVADYGTILGNTRGIIPNGKRGRGIIKDERVYVFQTATVVPVGRDRNEYITEWISDNTTASSVNTAIQIPTIPEFISGRQTAITGIDKIIVGMGFNDYQPVYYDFTDMNILYILGLDYRNVFLFAGGIIEEIEASTNVKIISLDNDVEEKTVVGIFDTAVARNNDYKNSGGKPSVDMTPIFVIIYGYDHVRKKLSDDVADKLRVILVKTEGFCNMYFVVCDTYASSNLYSAEEWVNRCGGNGVWIGEGIENQIRLQTGSARFDRNSLMAANDGYIVRRGGAEKVRVVMKEDCRSEVCDE